MITLCGTRDFYKSLISVFKMWIKVFKIFSQKYEIQLFYNTVTGEK